MEKYKFFDTKLYVDRSDIIWKYISNQVFWLLMRRWNWEPSKLYSTYWYRFKNLVNTWKISIYDMDSDTIKKLELSEEIEVNLWKYFQDIEKIESNLAYRNRWTFDCKAFVYFLKWLDINGEENWIEIDENYEFNIWDIIYSYFEKNDSCYHYVVYIWNWLCISKHWADRISVTTMNNIEKIYPWDKKELIIN